VSFTKSRVRLRKQEQIAGSPAVTLDVYAHLLPESSAAVVVKVDELLAGCAES